MYRHILFIDTEASGLPAKWDKPYSTKGNWPYAVQVSWLLYNVEGKLLKQEDHYISNNDFTITPQASRIHGLDKHFLQQHGQPRETVMQLLYNDLTAYQPLVVGHCLELDFHITGAEFMRIGKTNPMQQLTGYCTMLGSTQLVRNPAIKFLKLGQLYEELFGTALLNQHDALTDAKATADCFFALWEKGIVNNQTVYNQPPMHEPQTVEKKRSFRLGLALLLLLIIVAVVIYGKPH